jgi:hypothetical protein
VDCTKQLEAWKQRQHALSSPAGQQLGDEVEKDVVIFNASKGRAEVKFRVLKRDSILVRCMNGTRQDNRSKKHQNERLL